VATIAVECGQKSCGSGEGVFRVTAVLLGRGCQDHLPELIGGGLSDFDLNVLLQTYLKLAISYSTAVSESHAHFYLCLVLDHCRLSHG
jgi:hypothetical protein